MSPKIDDERGPTHGPRRRDHNLSHTTKISILYKCVMTIMRTYKFIDIYANVPLSMALG